MIANPNTIIHKIESTTTNHNVTNPVLNGHSSNAHGDPIFIAMITFIPIVVFTILFASYKFYLKIAEKSEYTNFEGNETLLEKLI